MKKSSTILFRSLLPVSALFISLPLVGFAASASSVEGAVADAKGDALKAMLKDIDTQLDALDKLEDNAPTASERAATKMRIKALKERRSELRKNFAQARYESLKADIKTEFDQLSAWTKKTFSNSPEAKLERKLDEAGDKARDTGDAARKMKADAAAAVNPAAVAASADLAAYKINPTDENKTDMKVSLDLLDDEISRLEQRVDNLPKGDARDATKVRVKALKERRSQLASDFRKARFDAVMADVKAEWQKVTN